MRQLNWDKVPPTPSSSISLSIINKSDCGLPVLRGFLSQTKHMSITAEHVHSAVIFSHFIFIVRSIITIQATLANTAPHGRNRIRRVENSHGEEKHMYNTLALYRITMDRREERKKSKLSKHTICFSILH